MKSAFYFANVFCFLSMTLVQAGAQEMPDFEAFYCEVDRIGKTKADIWEKLKGYSYYADKKEAVEKQFIK